MEYHSINLVITKLLSWVLFSVAIGLLPLIVNIFIQIFLERQQFTISYRSIFMHGEAFIFCAGLAAGGIGELISAEHLNHVSKYWVISAIGISVIIIICTSIAFAIVAIIQNGNRPKTNNIQEDNDKDSKIYNTSHAFLFTTMLVSGFCISIAAQYQ